MYLKDRWVDQMTKAMLLKHPKENKDSLRKRVSDLFDKQFKDSSCQIFNNYEDEIMDTTLSEVTGWMKSGYPLICESGCFFHQKREMRSLQTEIIKKCMLDARDIHKAEMFEAMKNHDTVTELTKQIQQLNDKKAANSGYGAEGEKSSFLYNLHSAMSVTAAGRGQLATMMQTIEALFADNALFFGEDDFIQKIINITDESSEWIYNTDLYLSTTPTRDEYIDRYKTQFFDKHNVPIDTIGKAYDSLTDELRKRTFYKSNIREFLKLSIPKSLLQKIADTDCDFIDPNDIPVDILSPLNTLTELVMEFVNYKYSIYKYEDRSRCKSRAVCIVSDTDSVFINCNNLLNFIKNHVIKISTKLSNDQKFNVKIVNVLVVLADAGIKATLNNYLSIVNVPKEDRVYVKAKNEYHYSIIITTTAMKSYFGLQIRQEGVILDPPRLDVKGVNFFKSTSSAKTTKFIYDDILMEEILAPKDGNIKIKRILSKIHRYQEEMTQSILEGDMGYLRTSVKVKSPDAYASPMSIGQYKACYVWNSVCEQHELIELPATVTLVKVKIRNQQDMAPLADFPGMFEKFSALLEDPNMLKEKRNGKKEVIGKEFTGIKAVALPLDYDRVPDWLLSIIDVETIVQDNIKLFTQLYKPLGLISGSSSYNGDSMTYYTNIIRI